MIRILASSAPLTLVVGSSSQLMRLALRIAHDVYLNHRLDVVIQRDELSDVWSSFTRQVRVPCSVVALSADQFADVASLVHWR
jgi:hypothetical protein